MIYIITKRTRKRKIYVKSIVRAVNMGTNVLARCCTRKRGGTQAAAQHMAFSNIYLGRGVKHGSAGGSTAPALHGTQWRAAEP